MRELPGVHGMFTTELCAQENMAIQSLCILFTDIAHLSETSMTAKVPSGSAAQPPNVLLQQKDHVGISTTAPCMMLQ